jgi:predicted pyridoxine 5'-phosphate oxidase superfamily flavin-nucleotide-binding protein
MTTIPKELHDLLAGGHNVWVATVAPDGTPNVSIKGSGALLDDEHLYFADMFSHKTRENLQHDPRVAVGIHDPERHVAMQVKGRAELIDHGDIFDQVSERLSKLSDRLSLPPVKYVVKIEVESVWDMGPGPHAGDELS